MTRKFQILDEAQTKAWGALHVVLEVRSGRRELLGSFNSILKGFYGSAMGSMMGQSSENVTKFVLGDDPAPSDWDMVLADMTVGYETSTIVRSYDAPGLTQTISITVPFGEANGSGIHTWYEAGLVTTGGRLTSRVAFRDPAGAIAGIIKHDEYRLIFTWVQGWGVTP